MALRFHLLYLLLACTPVHSNVGERDVGMIDTSRKPIRNAIPVSDDCRDPASVRIDGMARWGCDLAIASETSTDTENTP